MKVKELDELSKEEVMELLIGRSHRIWKTIDQDPIILYCPFNKDPTNPFNWSNNPTN